ncbi:hypothetical protein BBK82_20120 [Lentzea guizhouensis]|uniref:Uncharacterized protein n=2 Tax=Lentzea guizhouensis TaxID=1586287 RepID=A0A1B2HJY3_9PSEU|nr:hypothetical protein BBK82_20120 [Lentzea guizhouensis]
MRDPALNPETRPTRPRRRDGARDREKETRRVEFDILVVARNHTSTDRVLEVLHGLGDHLKPAIKFTIDAGSKFARQLGRRLEEMDAEELPWEEAKSRQWDLIIAAHADSRLGELTGPILVMPHGVGYNRKRLESTGGEQAAVGTSAHELMSNGRVYASLICLSHEEQRARLCEDARGHGIVVGDPVLDRLRAGTLLRRDIRRELGAGRRTVVSISTTWNEYSTLGTRPDVYRRLVAQLPADEYLVLAVFHPNVWFGRSPYEIRHDFRDELDSGLVLVDQTTWQAALIAADIVIGDHGSVTNYGVALDLPVLLAVDGSKEIDERSPLAGLHAALPHLVDGVPFRDQIEEALRDHRPDRWAPFVEQLFAMPGRGLESVVNAARSLIGLPPVSAPPRPRRPDSIKVVRGEPITAHRVVVREQRDDPVSLSIERYPAIVTTREDHPTSILVIRHDEIYPETRDLAEIIVHDEPLSAEEAETWLGESLANWGGALAAAALEGGGCLVRCRDGTRVSARGDPTTAAITAYWQLVRGNPVTTEDFEVS